MLSKLQSLFCIAGILLLQSCHENLTEYFADAEAPGLPIFSDKGNNILSCYVNGVPWRTIDRVRSGGIISIFTDYELDIYKRPQQGSNDTIVFSWHGFLVNGDSLKSGLSLTLSVKRDFDKNDFAAFEGQRLTIDSSINGYFTTSINGTNQLIKGNGSIYFHKAALDSIGNMSGLFEATINGLKFTKGRFDEDLDWANTHF